MAEYRPTPEQQAILDYQLGHHARILAGEGTGKSATVVALIDQLLSREDQLKVKLLTFTRAATGELAKKVSERPATATERPSTIHSFAISILLRNPGTGEFPKPLRIADDWERKNIVNPTLARRLGIHSRKLGELFHELAAGWESLESRRSPKVDPAERARFLGGWLEHREVYGYTLLSELPYALREALRDHPDLEGVDYDLVVVDEYQDLNACDLHVLRLLAERGVWIIGVGDDDQSIYSFRRAAPEGIRRFLGDYPDSADYPLSITHRCGSRIIAWASHVIEGDLSRSPDKRRLTPAQGSPPGEVALLAFAGAKAEVKGIAAIVRHLVEEEEIPTDKILILIRTDHQGTWSKPIKEALQKVDIACSDPEFIQEVLGEPDNRRAIALLRLLVQRADSLAWATLFKLTNGIGESFVNQLYEQARGNRKQLGEVVLEAFEEGFPGAPAQSRNQALELVGEILGWLTTFALPEETPEEGWGQWIIGAAGIGPLPELTEDMEKILLAVDTLIEPEQAFGRYLNLINPLARDWAQTESEGVRIMTMAASKGLTVEAAILIGLEEGVIPRPEVDLNEERRLLYVAMTRAKKFLFGTWARSRQGPTARAGRARVQERRTYSTFLRGGPVTSEDGPEYIKRRWS